MDAHLLIQALSKFFFGFVLVGTLLFVPAGTLYYWQAWLFMGVLFIPMFIVGVILVFRNPSLLRHRLDLKEKEGEQKRIVARSGLLFLTMFIIAGLNHRYGWWLLPNVVAIAAAVAFLIGYVLFAEVMRENVWVSRVIEVQESQQVVDTGLYGIVRHPMYSATLIMFLTMPLILASVWSFVLMLLYIPIIMKRIRNEEKVLEEELMGYKEYEQKVRWRLCPMIW